MSKNINILSQFKNACFIGLNRAEYFPENSDESLFADTWQDVTDEQSRRNMALFFFAPRDLDGEPVDPYVYLTETDEDDEQSALLAQQVFGSIPLIDMCRLRTENANEVNILIVADVIFHWDINDCYIQPTNSLTWIKDLKQILKSYPRTTEKTIFTRWDHTKINELDANIKDINALEINQDIWLNMPSFQEKFGNFMFLTSILLATAMYAGIYMQGEQLMDLSAKIRSVDMATPAELNYDELQRAIRDQKDFLRYRDYTSFAVRDVANAIQLSGMKIKSLEVKSPSPQTPTNYLFVSIQAKKDVYKGWLEEEPIAKALIGQSVSMEAIRRPPGDARFKLEGLIDLDKLSRKLQTYQIRNKKSSQKTLASTRKVAKPAVKKAEHTEDGGTK